MKYRHEDKQSNLDQMKAVSGLLEVAQRKSIVEDNWHEGQILRFSLSLQMKSRIANKKEQKAKIKPMQSQNLQKKHEKDRLKHLVRQQVNNEQTFLYQKEVLPIISERHQHIAKLDRNSKLFNTNMTFYSKQRNSNKQFIKSSLTFYGKTDRKTHLHQNNPQSYANINPQSNIVYFKPNKSETIRELLNQMKKSRDKNDKIILNSKNNAIEQQGSQVNEDEVGEVVRYKYSDSFRRQVNSLRMGENIWKRKFKQSWIRKKYDLQERRSHLKQLIVTD